MASFKHRRASLFLPNRISTVSVQPDYHHPDWLAIPQQRIAEAAGHSVPVPARAIELPKLVTRSHRCYKLGTQAAITITAQDNIRR
jgi:hypothetical protein